MKYLLALLVLLATTLPTKADCDSPNCEDRVVGDLRSGVTAPPSDYSSNVYTERRTAARYRSLEAERLADRDYQRWLKRMERERELSWEQERRRAARVRLERRSVQWAREGRREWELRQERQLYERQRRKAAPRSAQYYDEDYNRESGATCKMRMTGYGSNSFTRLGAESSARASWVTEVTDQYSRRYANVKRAQDRRYVCDPVSATRIACKFIARPCRAAEF